MKYRAERRNEARQWGKSYQDGRLIGWNYRWSYLTLKAYNEKHGRHNEMRHITFVRRMPGKRYLRDGKPVQQLGNIPGGRRRRIEAGYAD